MLWFILGSVAVVIAAACSIWASRASRRDITGGHPKYASVADATGVWNRTRLDQLFGPRDSDDRYTATAEQVYGIPKTWWKRLFDNNLCDLGCIIIALASPWFFRSQTALSIVLLAIAGGYIAIGYVGAVVVVIKSGSWAERGRPNRE